MYKKQREPTRSKIIINYLLTKSEVFMVKFQTEALLQYVYWPSDSKVNTARQRFDILPLRQNGRG